MRTKYVSGKPKHSPKSKNHHLCLTDTISVLVVSMRIAGMSYVTIGYFLRVIIDCLLPLSLVAPLSALTIIFSHIFDSVFIHNAAPSRGIMYCVGFSLVGIGLCLHGGNYIDGFYNISQISSLYFKSSSYMYAFLCLLVCFILRQLSFTSDLPFVKDTWTYLIAYINHSKPSLQSSMGLFYVSFITASIAMIFNVFMKGIVEIVKYSLIHGPIIGNLISFEIVLYIIAAAIAGFTKMMYVGYGLSQYNHLVFLPIYHVSHFLS